MPLFGWLVVGHLVGDWMLQTNWMARNKSGRWWSFPCIVHCLIYTGVLVGLAYWASAGALAAPQLLAFSLVILLSHWLIDGFRLAYHWSQWVNRTSLETVRLVVDQTMHLVVLVLAVQFILL